MTLVQLGYERLHRGYVSTPDGPQRLDPSSPTSTRIIEDTILQLLRSLRHDPLGRATYAEQSVELGETPNGRSAEIMNQTFPRSSSRNAPVGRLGHTRIATGNAEEEIASLRDAVSRMWVWAGGPFGPSTCRAGGLIDETH